jgi:nicotinate (nicotinamide) nucleotide adenylyltransferase
MGPHLSTTSLDGGSAGGKRTRVAVLGGAFDPITNAHMQLATEIVHSGCTDEVWLCPCGPRPDKASLSPAIDRYTMCELAVNTTVSPTFPIRVTRHEMDEEAMATYDSLCHLRDSHPTCDFSWVIGSDWLQPGTDLRSWESKEGRTGERLVSEFDFMVLRRPGYPEPDLHAFGPRLRWMDLPHGFKLVESNSSSTEVRKRARTWEENPHRLYHWQLDGLVAPGVLGYILRHQLYLNRDVSPEKLKEQRRD